MQKDKLVYCFDLESTILASFALKNLKYAAINLFLQKVSTFPIAKFTISNKNRHYVPNMFEIIESIYDV